MRTVRITDLITKSFDHTKRVLFQPFAFKKWLRLLFIAMLAGAISGGGLGGSWDNDSDDDAEVSLETKNAVNQEVQAGTPSAGEASTEKTTKRKESWKVASAKVKSYLASFPPGFLLGFGLFILLLITGLILLFTWLSARFKFVWLHAIMHNDAAISVPFREYRKQGDSFFKVSLVAGLLFLVLIGAVVFWVYGTIVAVGSLKNGIANMATAGLSLTVAAVIFLAAVVALCVWNIFVEHFVAPVMMLDKSTYLPSWGKFSGIYKKNRGDFWLYLLVILGIGIVCSIIEGILCMMLGLAGVLAAGVVGGIGYVVFAILLKAKILFIGFAVGAGIPLFIVFVLGIFSIFLPFAVFFRSFALYFFSSLNEGYVPLVLGEVEVKS